VFKKDWFQWMKMRLTYDKVHVSRTGSAETRCCIYQIFLWNKNKWKLWHRIFLQMNVSSCDVTRLKYCDAHIEVFWSKHYDTQSWVFVSSQIESNVTHILKLLCRHKSKVMWLSYWGYCVITNLRSYHVIRTWMEKHSPTPEKRLTTVAESFEVACFPNE